MTFANSENVLSFLMLPHTDKNSATAPLFGNQFFATSSSAFLVIHTSKKKILYNSLLPTTFATIPSTPIQWEPAVSFFLGNPSNFCVEIIVDLM